MHESSGRKGPTRKVKWRRCIILIQIKQVPPWGWDLKTDNFPDTLTQIPTQGTAEEEKGREGQTREVWHRGGNPETWEFHTRQRKRKSCQSKYLHTPTFFTDLDTMIVKQPASLTISAEQLTRTDGARESCEKKRGRERRRVGTRLDDRVSPTNA